VITFVKFSDDFVSLVAIDSPFPKGVSEKYTIKEKNDILRATLFGIAVLSIAFALGIWFIFFYHKTIVHEEKCDNCYVYHFNNDYLKGVMKCYEKIEEIEAPMYVGDFDTCPYQNVVYYPAKYYWDLFFQLQTLSIS